MAKEILAVPEEHLEEFIAIVRVGLTHTQVTSEVRRALTEWCDAEERYLKGGMDDPQRTAEDVDPGM